MLNEHIIYFLKNLITYEFEKALMVYNIIT